MNRSALAWSTIDFLSTLVLVALVWIAPPVEPVQQSIETLGQYAVVVTWPDRLDVDVDTHARLPDGTVVFFANPQAGGTHLERDDVGQRGENGLRRNVERVVLRAVQPGEYVFVVHLFAGDGPVPVTVRLYRLAGSDRLIRTWNRTLGFKGDEQTVSRVRFNRDGEITGYSDLRASLVGPDLPYP